MSGERSLQAEFSSRYDVLLATLFYIWLANMTREHRDAALRSLKVSGKWSMLVTLQVDRLARKARGRG